MGQIPSFAEPDAARSDRRLEGPPRPAAAGGPYAAIGLLFDLGPVSLSDRLVGRGGIEQVVPHRGDMLLLDWIVWTSPEYKHGVAVKHIRAGEFWTEGKPDATFPGLLMVEAGAQLACYLYNIRSPDRPNAAFLRMEEVTIRHHPRVGDDLYLLCAEVKWSRRRFVTDLQGVVGSRVAFTGRASGMAI